MADYLEEYAVRFDLPVRSRTHGAPGLPRDGRRFLVETSGRDYLADRVIVASGMHRGPKVPAFADRVNP